MGRLQRDLAFLQSQKAGLQQLVDSFAATPADEEPGGGVAGGGKEGTAEQEAGVTGGATSTTAAATATASTAAGEKQVAALEARLAELEAARESLEAQNAALLAGVGRGEAADAEATRLRAALELAESRCVARTAPCDMWNRPTASMSMWFVVWTRRCQHRGHPAMASAWVLRVVFLILCTATLGVALRRRRRSWRRPRRSYGACGVSGQAGRPRRASWRRPGRRSKLRSRAARRSGHSSRRKTLGYWPASKRPRCEHALHVCVHVGCGS